MDGICRAVGASGAMLLQGDVRTPDIPRTASFDEQTKCYFRGDWHIRDTRAKYAVPLLLRGASVVIDQDIMNAEQMRADAMYNELLSFQWFAGVGVWAESAFWGLSIQRTITQGAFEEQDKSALAGLSRQLTEVATLSAAVGRRVSSGATNALNAVRRPAIAIDRFGFVLDANPAMDCVFDDCIHVRNRRLFVADVEAKTRLNG